MSDQLDRPLSSYAFSEYGSDAKLYNGIHDLEEANERLGAELAAAKYDPDGQLRANLSNDAINQLVDAIKLAQVERDQARQQCKTLAKALRHIASYETYLEMKVPETDQALANGENAINYAREVLAAIPETEGQEGTAK